MNRTDILLAIIASADGKPLQPVHLQKVAFLVADEFASELPEDYYQFRKYRYGPFSAAIYQDAEMLEYWGLVKISRAENSREREYTVTDRHVIETLALPERVLTYIKETVDWASRQSFQELVRSIYYWYPEYQENSVFNYSEEEAFLDSFRRGINDLKEGRTYPASETLAELRRELESEHNADPLVE